MRMSQLSEQECAAGISRRAISSFQRKPNNGHRPIEPNTLEEHLAGKAIGSPEKTPVIDTWNRNLDLINMSGWHFGLRETDHSSNGVRVVEMFFTRPELEMLAERIKRVLSAVSAE
jgi:hypothetical protein